MTFSNVLFIYLPEYVDVKQFVVQQYTPVLIRLGNIGNNMNLYIHQKEFGYA